MTPQNEKVLQKHTEWGLASTFLAGAMLLVQASVLSAVFLGIKDNQGISYAVAIPFVIYCVGVPLVLLTALVGFIQPGRDRKFAKVGVGLTLAGPLVFALFLAVQTKFHPW